MTSDNQVALVFGALGTAGSAITQKLCEQGVTVVASARRETDGQALVDGLNESGHQAVYKNADISSRDEVIKTVEQTVSEFGTIPPCTS